MPVARLCKRREQAADVSIHRSDSRMGRRAHRWMEGLGSLREYPNQRIRGR